MECLIIQHVPKMNQQLIPACAYEVWQTAYLSMIRRLTRMSSYSSTVNHRRLNYGSTSHNFAHLLPVGWKKVWRHPNQLNQSQKTAPILVAYTANIVPIRWLQHTMPSDAGSRSSFVRRSRLGDFCPTNHGRFRGIDFVSIQYIEPFS